MAADGGRKCAPTSLLVRRTTSPLLREGRLLGLAHRARPKRSPRSRPRPADEEALGAELAWSCADDPPAWSRAYLGYAERFRDDYECELRRDARSYTVRIAQAPVAGAGHSAEARASSDGGLSTGSTVWDAGIVLARYAATLPRAGEQCVLLELGAGTGHVGLAAACLCPADGRLRALVLSDLPSVLDLLRGNAARNAKALPAALRIAVVGYRWGDVTDLAALRAAAGLAAGAPDRTRTICVGGDLLYRVEVVEPLVRALAALLFPADGGGGTCLPLAAEAVVSASMEHCPLAVTSFVERARAAQMRVEQVPFERLDAVFRSRSVVVLRITPASRRR
jgi:hypothetical protein